jgi:ribosomal protein S18 acetylase RimI-like enzyme
LLSVSRFEEGKMIPTNQVIRHGMISLELRLVEESNIYDCYDLMKELRPNLESPDDFVGQWRRQTAEGYQLIGLWEGNIPYALAGYRVQENFIHGRFLYVDDLITDEQERGMGLGASLIYALKVKASVEGCNKLVLDTGMSNFLAQRFYFRHGLLAKALRFYFGLHPIY